MPIKENKCGLIYYNTQQEVIIDECVEINKLFQKYEYCTLSYLLSSKQDSERPFSGHRVKLPIKFNKQFNNQCSSTNYSVNFFSKTVRKYAFLATHMKRHSF